MEQRFFATSTVARVCERCSQDYCAHSPLLICPVQPAKDLEDVLTLKRKEVIPNDDVGSESQ